MNTLDLRKEAIPNALNVFATPDTQRRAIATWRGRMVNEHASARVFEALANQMSRAGFSNEEVQTCAGFAEEERTHGILCGAVVSALGGRAIAPALPSSDLPEHEDVGLREAVLRNLLSISCLSESIAVSLIGAERLEMPPSELRDLLTRIYADEIGHARFGWGIVTREAKTLDLEAKSRLTEYLRVAFHHLETHELAHLPISAPYQKTDKNVGVCDGAAARELFYATVTEVIIARLNALGFDATYAWENRAGTITGSGAAAS